MNKQNEKKETMHSELNFEIHIAENSTNSSGVISFKNYSFSTRRQFLGPQKYFEMLETCYGGQDENQSIITHFRCT